MHPGNAQKIETFISIHQKADFQIYNIFKSLNNLGCLQQLLGIFTLRSTLRNRELRDKIRLHLPKIKSKMVQIMFKYTGAKEWNSLPIYIREITVTVTSINIFKQTLFTYLFNNDVNSHVFSRFFYNFDIVCKYCSSY